MPGYDKDIKEQFQLLIEYILPKIDHEDGEAVVLGYGVYRRTMENSFHLEHIKEELYRKQNNKEEIKTETEKDSREISVQETGEENLMQSSGMSENFWREDKAEKTDSHKLFGKKVAVFVCDAGSGRCYLAIFRGISSSSGYKYSFGILYWQEWVGLCWL